jgi:isopentenyl-diphosphate delta-isomerase
MKRNKKAEILILVDKNGNHLGEEEKEKCHDGIGLLHSAFMVMVFNDKNELMLAKRSRQKRLWPDFWDGTVASHYFQGQSREDCVKNRIFFEIGVQAIQMEYALNFYYQAKYGDLGSEHEICDLFLVKNIKNKDISINRSEISACRFLSIPELKKEIRSDPVKFSPWFLIACEKIPDLPCLGQPFI